MPNHLATQAYPKRQGGGDSPWAPYRTTVQCVIIVSTIIITTIIVIVVVAAVVAVVVIIIIIIVIIVIIIINAIYVMQLAWFNLCGVVTTALQQ